MFASNVIRMDSLFHMIWNNLLNDRSIGRNSIVIIPAESGHIPLLGCGLAGLTRGLGTQEVVDRQEVHKRFDG